MGETDKDINRAAERLNKRLEKLAKWAESLELQFSSTKSFIVNFTLKTKLDILPEIKLSNVNITYKDKAKYLGVILDKRLTWKDHVKDLICRANKRIGILKYIRDHNETIKTGQLITLYKSIVRPIMEYAAEVWGDASPYLKRKLDTIQHQALTKALEVNRLAHRHQVNYEAKVLPLEYRRLEKYYKFYKKISNTEMSKIYLSVDSTNRLKWNRRKSFIEKIQYFKNLLKLKD